MRFGSIILGFAVAVMMAVPAQAQTADNMLDLAYSTFLDRPGWTEMDAGKLEDEARAKLNAVDGALADARMSPLEKALFFVDISEPELARSRTLLRYGQVTTTGSDGAPVPVSFIVVDRYNLTTQEVPHVAWRFNFQPAEGMAAQLQHALRREIPTDEAIATDCLIAECLEPKASTDGSFAWKEKEAPAGGWNVPYPKAGASGHAASPFAAAEMAVALNIASVEGSDFRWRGPEQPESMTDGSPFLFFLDDRNISGNDTNDAIMGMIRLNDHAISEMWARRTDDGKSVNWANAVVSRSGSP